MKNIPFGNNNNFIVPKLINHSKSPSNPNTPYILPQINNKLISNNNINPIYNNYNGNSMQNIRLQTDINNYNNNNRNNNIYGNQNQINYNYNNYNPFILNNNNYNSPRNYIGNYNNFRPDLQNSSLYTNPILRLNRNFSHNSIINSVNNNSFNININQKAINKANIVYHNVININTNSQNQNIKKTKFNYPQKKSIIKNGIIIEDKDINIDFQENSLGNNNGNNNNIQKSINVQNKDRINNSKQFNISLSNDKNNKVKKTNKKNKTVKDKTQINPKFSKSTTNAKLSENNNNIIETNKNMKYNNLKINIDNNITKINEENDNEVANNNKTEGNIGNIVNNIENYHNLNQFNSIDKNIENKIPKTNPRNIIILNPNSTLNISENIDKLNGVEEENNPKGTNSKYNIKGVNAKSNIINTNYINEISKTNYNGENSNVIYNLTNPLEKDKKINTNKNNMTNIIKIDKISKKVRSPSKLTINIQNENNTNKLISIKDNSIINKSDIGKKVENNNSKINNFTENNIQNINKERIENNSPKNINNTFVNNSINKETKIEIPKKIKYFKNFKYNSLAGKDPFLINKINQDTALTEININNIEGFNAFGVLDGHGDEGHNVSNFAKNYIINEIKNYFLKLQINSLSDIYNELKKNDYFLIKNIYQNTDKELTKQNFNSNFSGTTCVIVFQIGYNLITANVGDSRAILISSDNSQLKNAKIIELSIDQKPDLPLEKQRIIKMGGIVDQMLDQNGKRDGPYRVWAGKENYPGLSMSRSIGDLKGKNCGLISTPEIIEYKLNDKSKYMVICSDGVWEFLENEDVMDIGNVFYINNEIDKFLYEIIKVSKFWWEKEDFIRDDITAVIVFF